MKHKNKLSDFRNIIMKKEEILKVIEKHLIRSVDGISEGMIDPEKKLTDYGANSLDIVEIVSGAMREMRVRIPRPELSEIKNIEGLVDKFIEHSFILLIFFHRYLAKFSKLFNKENVII